ncbi:MAG: DUF4381 domain-containing protein [Gammaproteobacteria bacterium]|nr:DUF4381 domain-containing protein [Gammaproteobacteria bacterium]
MNSTLAIRDIHTPTDVSFWPLAPVWWVLLILCALLIAYFIYKWWQRRHRLQALSLNDLRLQYAEHQDATRLVQQLSAWLRQQLMLRNATAAQLTNTAFAKALDAASGADLFKQADILQLAYQPNIRKEQAEHFLLLCEQWQQLVDSTAQHKKTKNKKNPNKHSNKHINKDQRHVDD